MSEMILRGRRMQLPENQQQPKPSTETAPMETRSKAATATISPTTADYVNSENRRSDRLVAKAVERSTVRRMVGQSPMGVNKNQKSLSAEKKKEATISETDDDSDDDDEESEEDEEEEERIDNRNRRGSKKVRLVKRRRVRKKEEDEEDDEDEKEETDAGAKDLANQSTPRITRSIIKKERDRRSTTPSTPAGIVSSTRTRRSTVLYQAEIGSSRKKNRGPTNDQSIERPAAAIGPKKSEFKKIGLRARIVTNNSDNKLGQSIVKMAVKKLRKVPIARLTNQRLRTASRSDEFKCDDDDEGEEAKNESASVDPSTNKSSEPMAYPLSSITALLSPPSQATMGMLLHRKVQLGIAEPSGQIVKPPPVRIDTNIEAEVLFKNQLSDWPLLPSPPPSMLSSSSAQAVSTSAPSTPSIQMDPILPVLSTTPHQIEADRSDPSPSPMVIRTSTPMVVNRAPIAFPTPTLLTPSKPPPSKPPPSTSNGQPNQWSPPFASSDPPPVICPICYEVFTSADNVERFERHARINHPRFWLSQTGSHGSLESPPIKPKSPPPMSVARMMRADRNWKRIRLTAEDTINTEDRYIPNMDLGPCVSCARLGIRCGNSKVECSNVH